MANYANLISAIQTVITENGNNEITGPLLQQTLVSIINALGSGYQFIGIATPSTTPGTPDQKVFYIGASGTYPNFGPAVIPDGNLAVFYYDSSWHYGTVAFPIGDGAVTTPKIADGAVTTPKIANGSVTQQKLASALLQLIVMLEDNNDADLDIKDDYGYVLARFSDGHFRTKYFNTLNAITKSIIDFANNQSADLDIKDENNNILARFSNGHFRVKNFNSADIGKTQWYGKIWAGFGTSITDISRKGKYPTYLAQLSGMSFVNHGHSGGGITSYSDQTIYNDVMTANLAGFDLITLEVGANDGSAPLGTVYDGLSGSDVQDNSTFCGALNKCIRHLQANSNAQIVVMCSPNARYQLNTPSNQYDGDETSGPDNHTTLERNLAIQKVCMLNSCWFIPAGAMDGFGYARMNASNNLVDDNIHHTNLGGYNFAQAIWAFLKNIPLFYQSID